ncbi:DUF222 domain-containing protein [Candidatus Poriferisocius sp.]|uniref:HNH endonuclease n=1 Tax=Candidatus Poriferisocius sp. TaxID=3101276 RepID=UPI003B59AB86
MSRTVGSTSEATPRGAGAVVWPVPVDVGSLSDDRLRDRLGVIGRAESCLSAMKAQTLAELARRHSPVEAGRIARQETRSSKRAARTEVETAGRLAGLAATSDALGAGVIPAGHARLIARAASEGPIDESLMVQAATHQDYDTFARTMARHQHEASGDDGHALHEHRLQKRSARVFTRPESGMFVLSAEFDPITGAHIDTVLAAKVRELWNQEDPKARRSSQQRTADALAELILEPEKGKTAGTALLVVADYDVVNQQLTDARLSDGTPIPAAELVRLACDADILPGVYRAATQEMNLGRKRRTATTTQRAALTYRDQHCIGCGTTAHRCFAHHIKFWSEGGPTDLANLALVCNDCHHNIHDHHWTVTHNPHTNRWHTHPPPDPFPTHGTTNTPPPPQTNPILRK